MDIEQISFMIKVNFLVIESLMRIVHGRLWKFKEMLENPKYF